MQFEKIAQSIAADGIIASSDILALRRTGWSDGEITPSQAKAIFDLNDALTERPEEWVDFFVEAIGDHVLNGIDPKGHVSEEQGYWLISRLSDSGHLNSMAELHLLTRLVEQADSVPENLRCFILEELERAILTGTGPTRCGGELAANHVTSAECTILRRVIFAPASDRPAAVSKREADLLFRIKQATRHAENAPEWEQLFVQGVANYLRGFSPSNAQLSRKKAKALDKFMSDRNHHAGRFLGRMAQEAPNSMGVVFGRKRTDSTVSLDKQVARAAQISTTEQKWLDDHLGPRGERDDYDCALLAFLSEERG
ncbi:hypothetical protein [Altericroceibacterium spongiae]|nr:hypothetical protein [Altericroceibacterium spongiae]